MLTEALGIEYKPSEIDDALRWALAELYVRRAAIAQQEGIHAILEAQKILWDQKSRHTHVAPTS